MNVKFYLDTRRAVEGGLFPLKVMLSFSGKTRCISLGMRLSHKMWDNVAQVVRGKAAAIKNAELAVLKAKLEVALQDCDNLKDGVEIVKSVLNPSSPKSESVGEMMERLAAAKKAKATRYRWFATKNTILRFYDIDSMPLHHITREWIEKLMGEMFASGLKTNTISVYLNALKFVVNQAIGEGKISSNPFFGVKLRSEETMHRYLDVTDIREIRDRRLSGSLEKARDFFMLSFYLIGMNSVDITGNPDYDGNRLRYVRSKTGKLFDIKVEPEAKSIIDRYKEPGCFVHFGKDNVVVSKCVNNNLRKIRPGLTVYWARHSWATIAAELDVPIEIISAALGHALGLKVTSVYVAVKKSKVDAANRLVIDYLNSDYEDASLFLEARRHQ